MKLPNDLIKATDYSKAKDREIHEFEYRNGKYIHKYVLGGEHELTPQEVVDCLNGLATIDCDLQTAYAFIQGQKDKIADLEAKLAEKDHTINTLIEDHKASQEWYKKQIAQKDKQLEKLKSENHALISDNAYQEADMFEFNSRIEQLQKQIADTEAQNKRVLEKLDLIVRSNQELEKQHDIDNQVIQLMEDNREKDKISFALEQLEKVKDWFISNSTHDYNNNAVLIDYTIPSVVSLLDNQIKQLKEMK